MIVFSGRLSSLPFSSWRGRCALLCTLFALPARKQAAFFLRPHLPPLPPHPDPGTKHNNTDLDSDLNPGNDPDPYPDPYADPYPSSYPDLTVSPTYRVPYPGLDLDPTLSLTSTPKRLLQ